MRQNKLFGILFGGTMLLCALPFSSFAQVNNSTVIGQANQTTPQSQTVVARIWHGKTLTSKAEEYYAYLKEAGIKKIESIPDNLGAQVLRRTDGKITEFTVIS
ncbi:MAG: hypothetical protein ACHBN1_25375 [Heteroscytonema crispum UTEX LB 1556]